MGDLPFETKVAFITGSARGIGAVIAEKFSRLGADVVITYKKEGTSSKAKGKSCVRKSTKRTVGPS
jgi:3-oxoacyl-[acyl-carrier protein] reductase